MYKCIQDLVDTIQYNTIYMQQYVIGEPIVQFDKHLD